MTRMPLLTLLAMLTVASAGAQARLGGTVAAGYAAGVDAPSLADGGASLRLALWRTRASGIEFGVQAGVDRHEQRTAAVRNLYLDETTGGIGTLDCAGCVPGTMETRVRGTSWHVAPMVQLRRRTGAVRPYAAAAAGLYLLDDDRRTRFLPSSGDAVPAPARTRDRTVTAGGSLTAGARLPLTAAIALDASAALHGAPRLGNDFIGGTVHAVFALGLSVPGWRRP